MLDKRQDQAQEATDGSTAVQAGRDAYVKVGLSYGEAKEVALDVFRANFLQMVGEAKEAATQRAEEITEKFLEKLQRENPAGMDQARSPDLQYGLFTVQREYARTADTNLGDLLVDVLVDRTKHPERDMLQIVLNECLNVAPKLTENQLAALSVLFFLKYCDTRAVVSLNALGEQLDKFIQPFVDLLPSSSVAFQHLQFAGCGSIQIGTTSLEEIIFQRYQGLFVRGFDPVLLSGCAFLFNLSQQIISRSSVDPTKHLVRAQNREHLDDILKACRISPADAERVKAAFNQNRLSADEIRLECIGLRPYLERLFGLWKKTDLHNFTLTSVGLALGHANIKRLAGEFADLSIWVQ